MFGTKCPDMIAASIQAGSTTAVPRREQQAMLQWRWWGIEQMPGLLRGWDVWECVCANMRIYMYIKLYVWLYNLPAKSVKSYIAQNRVLMQALKGCSRGRCRGARAKTEGTSNVLSPLTVCEGLVKCFGIAQSEIQGAVIYLLIKWMVLNMKRIQNYPRIK